MPEPSRTSRSTRQRAAIAAALEKADGFLSAQELHDALRGLDTGVGLTTVYRNLQAMADRGEVDVIRRVDGDALYRRCDVQTHHHHLVCHNCGYSVELENEALEKWAKAAARRHGFSDVRHDLELFGLCEACSKSA